MASMRLRKKSAVSMPVSLRKVFLEKRFLREAMHLVYPDSQAFMRVSGLLQGRLIISAMTSRHTSARSTLNSETNCRKAMSEKHSRASFALVRKALYQMRDRALLKKRKVAISKHDFGDHAATTHKEKRAHSVWNEPFAV